MWTRQILERLERGCEKIRVPRPAAMELLKWLYIRHELEFAGLPSSLPSKMAKLLKWLQDHMEGDAGFAKDFEYFFGHIEPGPDDTGLSDDEKTVRRMRTMNCFAEKGWECQIHLWEERDKSNSIFRDIRSIRLIKNRFQTESIEQITMYCCTDNGIGSNNIFDLPGDYYQVIQEDEAYYKQCLQCYAKGLSTKVASVVAYDLTGDYEEVRVKSRDFGPFTLYISKSYIDETIVQDVLAAIAFSRHHKLGFLWLKSDGEVLNRDLRLADKDGKISLELELHVRSSTVKAVATSHF